MQEERFFVRYVSVKNCFVCLPEIWGRRLDRQENCIKISHNKNDYYVSWRPSSGTDEFLGIGATFAQILNIQEGDEVFVSSMLKTPFLSTIAVVPRNIEDWNIVEYQAEKIQTVLLDQISVIGKNQSFVVWISKGLSVILTVEAVSPDFPYGKIGNHTEVHVSLPKSESSSSKNNKTSGEASKISQIWNFFTKIPFRTANNSPPIEESNTIESWLEKNEIPEIPEAFRVLDLSTITSNPSFESSQFSRQMQYAVFIIENAKASKYSKEPSENADICLYQIHKIKEDRQQAIASSTNYLRPANLSSCPELSSELVVRVVTVKKSLDDRSFKKVENCSINDNCPHNSIYVHKNLRKNLNLHVGSRVLLEPLATPSIQPLTSIDVFPSAGTVTRELVEKILCDSAFDNKILVNSRSRINFDDETYCVLLILPQTISHALMDTESLKNLVINVRTVEKTQENIFDDSLEESQDLDLAGISLIPFDRLMTECLTVLELSLGLAAERCFRYEPANILVCGSVGVGKTTFCRILLDNMRKALYFVHKCVIECKALKGKRAEAMHKIITAAFAECVYYQPSILFLDDLESITSSASSDDENTPDAINASRILEIIFNVSAEYQSAHYVSIVATCTHINNIGAKLRSSRGVHLFRTILTIPDLAKDHRIDILKKLLGKFEHAPNSIDWDYYGNKTEGWAAQDLFDFAEKSSFTAWKRHVKSESKNCLSVIDEDLSETLKNYRTMALHGVQLYKSSGDDWSCIGGLEKVKIVLEQLLKWPLKYPELYRNAPIKNQNGALLYGMPGTGKTILAGAIAQECGLNLISVKGPELLSKYIGASEEAVRNIFEKARRAKPCVLFFDEFDSLAPRRGHDSTGVTDRVVNQLLTQLDGVEGREGVAVVAASSRPDLLDPALLRPGRLDKSLLCPLPDEADREAILGVLCKKQGIDSLKLDLKGLAASSKDFTGADLNAVLTQAKYDALETAIGNIPTGDNVSVDSIEITQDHLVKSLNSTKPSLSTLEKEKYRRIYEQFSSGSIMENDAFINQKATLA